MRGIGVGMVHPDELPQRDEDLLAERDHVVLLDEAHLDVELRELRLTVGAEVLVAVAAGDLVVPLEPADHEQLLEQLRRLRQRVPGAGRQARGHQEVAGALGRRARQGRRLDLDEVLRVEHAAGGLVGLGAQAHRAGGRGPAQVEVAVLEARLLADDLVERRRDLERQRRGLVEHDDVGGDELDLAGGEVAGSRCPPGRRPTSPVTCSTYSARSPCATASSRMTTWAMPEASRRSTNATPP